MKNIFKNFSFEKMYEKLKETFTKFPLSFISAFIVFWVIEFLILQDNFITNYTEELLSKSIFSICLFYFLSIWIYLLSYKQSLSKAKTCIIQLFAILFSIFFFFSFPENLFNNFFIEEITYVIITFIWVISFIFISSFLKRVGKKDTDFNDRYYSFFNEISSKILMSIIVWVSLMLLWFVALWSLFSLFELKDILDESKTFWTWAAFAISLFAPIYFLYQAWQNSDNLINKITENKFYSFLNNYLALPFIIIYFVILYSYTFKVLLNFSDWPQGIISWMVILFSLFWYLIYIFSYAFEEKMNLVKVYRKFFPLAVILQTPMLFYAIYLRINQYDLTINRYLVVVFGIFLIVVSLYLLISKKKYIISIPATLTVFIIIISIWPWWVYMLPESRQLNLLENNLVNAKILQNWNVVLPKNENDIENQLSWKIYDEVTYLCEFHGCDSLNRFFPDLIKEIKNEDKIEWEKNHAEQIQKYEETIKTNTSENEKEALAKLRKEIYLWIYSWNFQSKLVEKLKVKPYYADKTSQEYLNFNLKNGIRYSSIEVRNYDYIFDISNEKLPQEKENIPYYEAKFDANSNKLTINKNWISIEEFGITDDLKKAYEDNKNNVWTYWNVSIENPIELVKNWNKIDIKIILTDFSIRNPDYKWDRLNTYSPYINWKILLKEKN